MTAIDTVLGANRRFAETFESGSLPAPPARHLAIVTCMDARLDPQRFLGLDLGAAHVIRNAGGRVSDDVLRSLIISSHLLGTREYAVIHHTSCGMLGLDNEQLRHELSRDTGVDASHLDFLPFADLEESVREDVTRIASCPFIPDDVTVRGFIYDVATGWLSEVSATE
jgi:carbonic anhydrase